MSRVSAGKRLARSSRLKPHTNIHTPTAASSSASSCLITNSLLLLPSMLLALTAKSTVRTAAVLRRFLLFTGRAAALKSTGDGGGKKRGAKAKADGMNSTCLRPHSSNTLAYRFSANPLAASIPAVAVSHGTLLSHGRHCPPHSGVVTPCGVLLANVYGLCAVPFASFRAKRLKVPLRQCTPLNGLCVFSFS